MAAQLPWTEASLADLGPDEYDFREFKGSAWLTDGHGAVQPDFPLLLSKQVSAFANGAGGRLFIGIDDHGAIDGGVPVDLKSGGVRSWLEDVVPGMVDPPLPRFNVYEVLPDGQASAISPGSAVYVVEIPSSDLAPHQAMDYRYYLRIAGKSRPMGNVHIQDVLRRTRHPVVEVTRVTPYGRTEHITTDPRGPKALLSLRIFIANHSRNLANHVGAEIVVPRSLVSREVRERTTVSEDVRLTQSPGAVSFFRYQPHPLFPGQTIFFLRIWVAIHSGNADAVADGSASVAWRVFADDAPATEGSHALNEFAAARRSADWVRSLAGSKAPPRA